MEKFHKIDKRIATFIRISRVNEQNKSKINPKIVMIDGFCNKMSKFDGASYQHQLEG